MIKNITLNIKIEHDDRTVKHRWLITGFMHRKLKLIENNNLHLLTATELRDWFMKVLKGVA